MTTRDDVGSALRDHAEGSGETGKGEKRETKEQKRARYLEDCHRTAQELARSPWHRSDPFAYGRAYSLMAREILDPADVRSKSFQVSI